MSDVDDTLRAVLLNPAEDVPRLIHADALEERDGDNGRDRARAELIRLQVDVHNGAHGPSCRNYVGRLCGQRWCRFCKAEIRASEILNVRRPAWIPDYHHWNRPMVWRRGFVDELNIGMLPTASYRGWLRRMAALHPFAKVNFVGALNRVRNGDEWYWTTCNIPGTSSNNVPYLDHVFRLYLDPAYAQPVVERGNVVYTVFRYPAPDIAASDMADAIVKYAHAPLRNPELLAMEDEQT